MEEKSVHLIADSKQRQRAAGTRNNQEATHFLQLGPTS
jgi:hypothetical protein